MKKLIKWIFRLVVLLVVAVVSVVLLRNILLRAALERRLEKVTGLPTIIGSVHTELRSPVITLRDVRLMTPRDLGTRPCLEIPEVHLQYDPLLLTREQLRFPAVKIRIADVFLTRSADGRSTQTLLVNRARTGGGLLAEMVKPFQFDRIDSFTLALERYKFLDYYQMFRSQELLIGIKGITFTNLTTGDDFLRIMERIAEEKGIQPPPLKVDAPPAAATNVASGSTTLRTAAIRYGP